MSHDHPSFNKTSWYLWVFRFKKQTFTTILQQDGKNLIHFRSMTQHHQKNCKGEKRNKHKGGCVVPLFPQSLANLPTRAVFPAPVGPYRRTGHLWLTANKTISKLLRKASVRKKGFPLDLISLHKFYMIRCLDNTHERKQLSRARG